MPDNVITYFNWDELLVSGRKDINAIICLTYGITKDYNEYSAKTLMKSLRINRIPAFLFHSKIFTQYKHTLTCNYKVKEPQSYIRNVEFLKMGAPARDKAVYLKALSMRRITEKENYIPLSYFPNISKNIFLDIQPDRIYFPYEE